MENKIKLTDLPKQHPFKVPDGYFESLQTKIEKRIEESGEPKIIAFKPKSNWYNWKRWSIAAAASLLIISGIYYQNNISQINDTNQKLAQISDNQIAQYIENQDIVLADLTETVNLESNDLDQIFNEHIDTNTDKLIENLEKGYLLN